MTLWDDVLCVPPVEAGLATRRAASLCIPKTEKASMLTVEVDRRKSLECGVDLNSPAPSRASPAMNSPGLRPIMSPYPLEMSTSLPASFGASYLHQTLSSPVPQSKSANRRFNEQSVSRPVRASASPRTQQSAKVFSWYNPL